MQSVSELILIFAALSGFFIALYIRHKKLTNERMVCYLGADCQKVIHSQFSVFFGIPVEILGILYYVVIAVSYGILIAYPQLAVPGVVFSLLGATSAAFLFTLYLVFIQTFTLKEWCTWCLLSAGLCTIIFFAGLSSVNHNLIAFLASVHPLVLILHIFGMGVGVGAAMITDVFFFKFLKDFKISEAEADILHTLSQVIWAALGIAVISGIGLYLPEMNFYNDSTKFLVKMVVVAVIIINGAFLNLFISPRMHQISFGEAHPHVVGELHHFRKFAFASGAISMTSWVSALMLGALSSVPFSFVPLMSLYLVLLICAIIVSQIVERMISRRALEN